MSAQLEASVLAIQLSTGEFRASLHCVVTNASNSVNGRSMFVGCAWLIRGTSVTATTF